MYCEKICEIICGDIEYNWRSTIFDNSVITNIDLPDNDADYEIIPSDNIYNSVNERIMYYKEMGFYNYLDSVFSDVNNDFALMEKHGYFKGNIIIQPLI